ncbi:type III secretion system export apparatus subunit SctT [Edwardsiella piscicida]|nr:type III secretion system export apparatus subunit SctT [Edwardsiella piscicida]AAX76924.1 EsaT [Edwardsiella tarda]ACY83727.1 type III secretion apparatus protein [Edwardsiella tarda EIB202]AGH72978.1 type III secretion apparatus protein [Edwardsiella piscicida C07-087]AOP44720.2 type III secretion system export apparatus subunit SctT [Edwardsiella piscicida]EKS7765442.1 type III secretion system export apparatus subunit SctT [Edwardsiella piscicida]
MMAELNHWWPLLGIAMMRPLGIMLIMPLFNSAMLGGALIRNALALMAALPALPQLAALVLPSPLQAPLHYGGLLLGELVLGLLLGFSAALPLWALNMAGFIIDTMRGASIAVLFNPLLGEQSSPMGVLFSQLVGVLFIVGGGFHALLAALFSSYGDLPPGQYWLWGRGFIPLLMHLWHLLYTLALSFSMPAMVMMVLVDLALGFINRSVQQLNVFTLSMPIKSAMVLLMLIISLPFALDGVQALFTRFDGGLLRQLAEAL